MRPCLFDGKFHRQLRLTKTKRNFEDNKTKIQFMRKQLEKEQDDYKRREKQVDALIGGKS